MIPKASQWRPHSPMYFVSVPLLFTRWVTPHSLRPHGRSLLHFPVLSSLPRFTHFLTCSFLCILFFLLTFFLIFSTSSQTHFIRMYSNSTFPSNVSSWLWSQRLKKKNHAWHSKTLENVFCKVLTAHFSLKSWAEICILCRIGLFH